MREQRLLLQQIDTYYGPASDNLSDAQPELPELEPGVSSAETRTEGECEPMPASTGGRKRRPRPGRQKPPEERPPVELVIARAPEQYICRVRGRPMAAIGYERSGLPAGVHALPSSALSHAVRYRLALWPKLTPFLERPEVESSKQLGREFDAPGRSGTGNGATWTVHGPDRKWRPFGPSWGVAAA